MTEQKLRVLVVDDEASICQILKAGLEMHGFDVRCETRSADTIPVCLDFHPDLVLLDVDMPDKDGGQVASELRSHPTLCRTPVIFLTSLVTKEETGKQNASREVLLSKQIRIPELVSSIRDVLHSQTVTVG